MFLDVAGLESVNSNSNRCRIIIIFIIISDTNESIISKSFFVRFSRFKTSCSIKFNSQKTTKRNKYASSHTSHCPIHSSSIRKNKQILNEIKEEYSKRRIRSKSVWHRVYKYKYFDLIKERKKWEKKKSNLQRKGHLVEQPNTANFVLCLVC